MAVAEMEEARQRRLTRIEMIKKIWEKKIQAKNLKKMLSMLRELSPEDLEMEVEIVELKTLEMMELEEELDGYTNVLDMDILEERYDDCTDVKMEHQPNITNTEGGLQSLNIRFIHILFKISICHIGMS